jgi:hypothetical protein
MVVLVLHAKRLADATTDLQDVKDSRTPIEEDLSGFSGEATGLERQANPTRLRGDDGPIADTACRRVGHGPSRW